VTTAPEKFPDEIAALTRAVPEVLENVFSGMARAILANSDYVSIDGGPSRNRLLYSGAKRKVRLRTEARGGMGFGTRTTSILRIPILQRSARSVNRKQDLRSKLPQVLTGWLR
jgi:hypothetical protein